MQPPSEFLGRGRPERWCLGRRRLVRDRRRLSRGLGRRRGGLFAVDRRLGVCGAFFGGRRHFLGAFFAGRSHLVRDLFGRFSHLFGSLLSGIGDHFGIVLHGLAHRFGLILRQCRISGRILGGVCGEQRRQHQAAHGREKVAFHGRLQRKDPERRSKHAIPLSTENIPIFFPQQRLL